MGLDRHADSRGSLVAFEGGWPVPFEIKNVFFILDCPPNAVRAEHAVSSDTALIAVRSAVTVDVDNGRERHSLRLDQPDRALVVRAGVWLRLREFDEHTVLAVLASQAYADRTYSDEPIPGLLDSIKT